MTRVLVIGARRTRQGIGEFVARWFHDAGAEVAGIVGTATETVRAAVDLLGERYGISCRGFTSLQEALEEVDPDIAAICSPIEFHREQLEAISEAGVHCLCEKPMWWESAPDRARVTETTDLVDAFVRQKLVVGLITQWPQTLPAFHTLFPEVEHQPLERFEMLLSPTTTGPRAVLDSASHPISMLRHLAGNGAIERPVIAYPEKTADSMRIDFGYRHARGLTDVTCLFRTRQSPPRPAAYAINGCRVVRAIDLPDYEIYFESGARRVRVEDPLKLLVEAFLGSVHGRSSTDRQGLIESIVNLEVLHEAALRETTGGSWRE